MNGYEQLKIAHAIRIVVGPYRTVVICCDGVRGVMTVDMRMDEASAMVRRAMVVDMCMNERSGERSPLERD